MAELPLDYQAPFATTAYWLLAALVLFGRTSDLASTWVVTPGLVLEANPLAKALGWRAGIAVNLAACLGLGFFPIAAIAVATTSILVAARNLQSAWLVRTLGEHEYRAWMSARFRETSRPAFIALLLSQSGLYALLGIGLILASPNRLVPFSVGFGILVYSLAVTFYVALGMRRGSRRPAPPPPPPPPPPGTPP